MKILRIVSILAQFLLGCMLAVLIGKSLFWKIVATVALSLFLVLMAAKLAQVFNWRPFRPVADRMLNTFYAESLIPIIVSTLVLSAITYFANSRDFYFIGSNDQVRDPSHIIIPPSEHLIQSDEEYTVQVMVKKPFRWKRDAEKPLVACFLIFTIAPYTKRNQRDAGFTE